MSFKENFFKENEIKNVLHIGADRGGEHPQYKSIGVENVVWVEANPEVYCELIENIRTYQEMLGNHIRYYEIVEQILQSDRKSYTIVINNTKLN